MIDLKKINPHPDETYYIGVDDHCLVVTTKDKEPRNKVWLSKSMIKWLGEFGEKYIENAYMEHPIK